ncbi:hypothetical protein GE061_004839 [Apolygus lucorum]|uniref:Uncharacterized protein n=1 Tax=Apolygus lucorum TaxID=248454 RepID=A0A6A4J3R1_APOLU|nr:hypothetical protein GE061_004839 [Apolygus lucorum]
MKGLLFCFAIFLFVGISSAITIEDHGCACCFDNNGCSIYGSCYNKCEEIIRNSGISLGQQDHIRLRHVD